jgi:outer membrane protein assembly factor BamB
LTVALAALVLMSVAIGCGSSHGSGDWPRPNLDLASTRALPASGIDASNVGRLHVAWRFRFPGRSGDSGAFTATPIVVGKVVYVQDMASNVYALDLTTGKVLWRRLFKAASPGPNGIAVVDGRVYGATDSSAFALEASTGRPLWRHFLVTETARFIDIAPQVADGLVFVSTIGLPPNGRGVLYALDAATGRIRWELSTIKEAWRVPSEAGGGGAWETPSVSGHEVYWGTTNPYPYGGNPAHPNGGSYAGDALYTDTLMAIDTKTGKLDWYDQVTPHDVRDYDFQLPPILASLGGRSVVFGAGKAGLVIAWDSSTHDRLWETAVGTHRNDRGPLPRRPVAVCPGLLGGVETPMAYAGGRLFVPVVDLCMRGSSVGYESLDKVNVAKRGRGELVALDAATGREVWRLRLPQANFGCATVANGVVFTSTFDGAVYGVDAGNGRILWRTGLHAGVNACPALSSGWLLIGAGVPTGPGSRLELAAFTVETRS